MELPLVFDSVKTGIETYAGLKKSARLIGRRRFLLPEVWHWPFAKSGRAESQNKLGLVCYFREKDGSRNYEEAAKWFQLAAEQGHAKAQFNLGVMHSNGQGVELNHETAAEHYRRAANQKHAGAQHNLGLLYLIGRGVSQHYKEAAKWHECAANQEIVSAQSNLGVMYEQGRGVSQNSETAVKWYRRAAGQGHSVAQYNLGVSYLKGLGKLPQSVVYAHMWINLSATSGDEESAKARNAIASAMTPDQIAKAQDLAVECQKKGYKDC